MVLRHAALPLLLLTVVAGGHLTSDLGAPHAISTKEQPLKHLAPRPPDTSRKNAALADRDPRTIAMKATFVNLHTREVWPVHDGALAPAELAAFLRCRATGRTHAMDPEPAEVALAMAERFEADRIEVVSGYRSDKFNESLRKKGHGVASRSRHVQGQALDFRVPGVRAPALARAVADVHEGGIGTYGESDFVHVDVGPNRRWRGR